MAKMKISYREFKVPVRAWPESDPDMSKLYAQVGPGERIVSVWRSDVTGSSCVELTALIEKSEEWEETGTTTTGTGARVVAARTPHKSATKRVEYQKSGTASSRKSAHLISDAEDHTSFLRFEHCPECDMPVVKRYNRYNGHPFIGCTGFPECEWTRNISVVEDRYRYDMKFVDVRDGYYDKEEGIPLNNSVKGCCGGCGPMGDCICGEDDLPPYP